jgi:hypothetical protein
VVPTPGRIYTQIEFPFFHVIMGLNCVYILPAGVAKQCDRRF